MSSKKEINPDSPHLLYFFGRPFAPLYAGIMAGRAALYRRRFLRSDKLGVPVISVGNLTLGGSGKTPMVIYLARLLAKRRVAIVSRGYKGNAKGRVNVVSDGKEVLLDAGMAGDEPNLMASLLPGVPVVTGPKRIFPARYCEQELAADLILLDDGFQHLALQRDLDIVLFKVDTFMGNSRIFPGGDLREPLAALERAHCFVLTCVDDDNRQRADAIQAALEKRFPHIAVFQSGYQPQGLVPHTGDMVPLAQSTFGAFCGLAAPRLFQKSLQQAGLNIAYFKGFADHHSYSLRQLQSVASKAAEAGAVALITTEKDMVKLKDVELSLPLYALRMEVSMGPEFTDFLFARLAPVEK